MNKNNNKINMLKELRNILLASTLVITPITGCVKNNNDTKTTEIVSEATSESTTISATEITTESSTISTTEVVTESTNSDEEVINELKKDQDELQNAYDDHNTESLGQKGKKYFIKVVDFIFYDGEIKGVKFDELKEESKEVIYNELCEMDELIMTLAPNYKENIGEKYEVVKDFTNKAYFYVLDKLKAALGEERYDKIGEIKDSVKDKLGDLYDNGKTKIKDWYEEFKNK